MKTTPLDKHTLDLVKKLYPLGAKIEAIKVNAIPKGMRGVVWNVEKNGDIEVKWSNGDTSRVERGIESIRVVKDGFCMLGKSENNCNNEHCEGCGWNNKVYKERVNRIRSGCMVEKENGVRVLKIEKTTSTNAN